MKFLATVCLFLIGCLAGISQSSSSLEGTGHITLIGDGSSVNNATLPPNTPLYIWSPQQNAFRFGKFSSPQNSRFLSPDSIAGGVNTEAGNGSIALGVSSRAFGSSAIAFGLRAEAGSGGISLGIDASAGSSSIALGELSFSRGTGSVAFGAGSFVNADHSIALAGGFVEGASFWSIALGGDPWGVSQTTQQASFAAIGGSASATNGIAIGSRTAVIGPGGTAIGSALQVSGSGQTALGVSNLNTRKDGSVINPSNPSADDPIFEVGNGSYGFNDGDALVRSPSNAFTIYRDGTVRLSKASGGISMGIFN